MKKVRGKKPQTQTYTLVYLVDGTVLLGRFRNDAESEHVNVMDDTWAVDQTYQPGEDMYEGSMGRVTINWDHVMFHRDVTILPPKMRH